VKTFKAAISYHAWNFVFLQLQSKNEAFYTQTVFHPLPQYQPTFTLHDKMLMVFFFFFFLFFWNCLILFDSPALQDNARGRKLREELRRSKFPRVLKRATLHSHYFLSTHWKIMSNLLTTTLLVLRLWGGVVTWLQYQQMAKGKCVLPNAATEFDRWQFAFLKWNRNLARILLTNVLNTECCS